MPPIPFQQITGVILDGGKASRLGGAHKAFLEVGGEPIAARTTRLFRALFADIVVATSRPVPWASLGVRTVADPVTDAGPLAGLAGSLLACSTPFAFVAAGDMPELSAEVIAELCRRAVARGGCVVPRVDGRPEPLHAVHATSLGAPALGALERGTRKLTVFLAEAEAAGLARVTWVDAAELAGLPGADRTFRNVNTPEDVRDAPHGSP